MMTWMASSKSFISSFDVYLLSSFFVPGSILGTGDTEVDKDRGSRETGESYVGWRCGRGNITWAKGQKAHAGC